MAVASTLLLVLGALAGGTLESGSGEAGTLAVPDARVVPTISGATWPGERAILRSDTCRAPVGVGDRRGDGRGPGSSGSGEWVLPPVDWVSTNGRRQLQIEQRPEPGSLIVWLQSVVAPRGPPAISVA